MLTSKDIRTKSFEMVKNGFDPQAVEDYLKEAADTLEAFEEKYRDMEKEVEETERKMGRLVDAVRDYKSREDAIKDAMIGAHTEKQQILADANAKAEEILAEARAKADDLLGPTEESIKKEEERLAQMQKAVGDFKHKILEMYRDQISLLQDLPDDDGDEEDEDEEIEEEEEIFEEIEEDTAPDSFEKTIVMDTIK